MRYLLSIAVTVLVSTAPARAGGIEISNPWVRAMPAGLPDAGYFTIHNASRDAIVLVGASSPACGMLMLHKSSTEGGIAGMTEVPNVRIDGGQTLSFAPGGYHLMCSSPSREVRPGRQVAILLEFAASPPVKVRFTVRDARGR
ncbi:MAG: copper chaperone PCu(A)C [Alphaproteobacteria bacterium]|nr:copper chaperone PCu(A)C [Alphaproteobacteria bacterium]